MYKYLLALAAITGLFIGCENKGRHSGTTSENMGATTTAPAAESPTMHPALRGENQGNAITRQDRDFVREAAQGGRLEVQLGQTAEKQAESQDVKSFGRRMIRDHEQANKELLQLAERKGLPVPSGIGDEHKGMVQHLSSLQGAAFDRAYMGHMVSDHEKDIASFREEAQSGQDPDVKAFAKKTLDTLEEHLKMARDIDGKVQKEKTENMEQNPPATAPAGT